MESQFCEKCGLARALHRHGECPQELIEHMLEARPSTGRANDVQVGGTHYKDRRIQPWDFIAANSLDFFQGSIVKYVVRFREKDGIKDLQKAAHYLTKLIELEMSRARSDSTSPSSVGSSPPSGTTPKRSSGPP